MDLEQLKREIAAKMEDVKRFVSEQAPDIVGVEAVNHFKESFDNEGFTDESIEEWQDVKRRDPDSFWYGFSGFSQGEKQFSQVRTTAKILTGETGELANAITYTKQPGEVVVSNDKPYAAVHNFGGQAKIFGKKEFTMPTRKFMGHSKALDNKINDKIIKEITKILKA